MAGAITPALRTGLLLALVVIVLDQLTKWLVLDSAGSCQ